jgi:hypothetical protein
MSVPDGLSRYSKTVPANRVAVRLIALVQERSDFEEEVSGSHELVREEVKDGLSMCFRDDNPAAPQQRLGFVLYRPSIHKEA